MRRSLLCFVLLFLGSLAACDREADQRAHCAKFIEPYATVNPERWIEQCVKHRWTTKQMECHAKTGGFQAMFCDE